MKKTSALLLSALLVPAFGASASAQNFQYDRPQESAPAQFHRDVAKFPRDEKPTPNQNLTPANVMNTQLAPDFHRDSYPGAQPRIQRVRDDQDQDHDNNGRRGNWNRGDNDHHDNNGNNNPHGDNDHHDNNANNNRHDNDHDNRAGNDNRHGDRDWGRDRHDNRQASRRWRGWSNDRDIRYFHQRDFSSWRGGHWRHGVHNGRSGWWWAVGNLLYFYSQPVYPYPDPYAPGVVIENAEYSQGYWYYCADPSGYYPYVNECYVPWRAVPQ